MRLLIGILIFVALVLLLVSVKITNKTVVVKNESYDDVVHVLDSGASMLSRHGFYFLYLGKSQKVVKVRTSYIAKIEIVPKEKEDNRFGGRVDVQWVKTVHRFKFLGEGEVYVGTLKIIGVPKIEKAMEK